jgi:DNA polymerase III alpha subunit
VYKFDIDIDLATFDPLEVFPGVAVRASMVSKEGDLVPHACGVYLQAVPTDPLTGLAAVPYATAEDLGCFKIDFLHLELYDSFASRADIKELLKVEPDWTLLQIPSIVQGKGKEKGVFQLSKHLDILQAVKPRSVLELADCLALIRPQKRFLLDLYLRDREKARTMLWTREGDEGYGFKKAHALAYAYVIILQLHIIKAS